jgi:hypothetical protein
MSRYTERYRTPSPLFPLASPTSLPRLLAAWEELRRLNVEGYRTSSAQPPSTWLAQIQWAHGRTTGRSVGRGTTCSPFVTQATALAYSSSPHEPYTPELAGGAALPLLFSHAANGALRPQNPAHKKLMEQYGMTLADSEWPRPIIFFNMGFSVEPEQMRRGDAVHIDWCSGGGHAVFCWDVHLNPRGEVDAFSYVSSNGSMKGGGSGGGISVGGTSRGAGHLITQEGELYAVHKSPLFVDDPVYVTEGAWVSWDDSVAGTFLKDLRCQPKTRVKKIKRVAVARFFGVAPTQVPLFAMGEDVPGGPRRPTADNRAVSSASPNVQKQDPQSDGLLTLQRRLKLLQLIGWLHSDVGQLDGKPGRKTTSALMEFQRTYGLRPDGKPGPLTHARLEAIFRSACDAPLSKRFLDPQHKGGLVFARVDWQERARLYFRHGVAQAGTHVTLILTGEELPQRTLTVQLVDAHSQQPLSNQEYPLPCLGTRASVEVLLPISAVNKAIGARIAGCELQTEAPLRVHS